jgi:hypothetical protein
VAARGARNGIADWLAGTTMAETQEDHHNDVKSKPHDHPAMTE